MTAMTLRLMLFCIFKMVDMRCWSLSSEVMKSKKVQTIYLRYGNLCANIIKKKNK